MARGLGLLLKKAKQQQAAANGAPPASASSEPLLPPAKRQKNSAAASPASRQQPKAQPKSAAPKHKHAHATGKGKGKGQATKAAAKPQQQAGAVDDEDNNLVDPTKLLGDKSAYEALVGMFSSSGGAYSSALRRLQQQQRGDSDADSSSDEDEEDVSGEGEEDGDSEEGSDMQEGELEDVDGMDGEEGDQEHRGKPRKRGKRSAAGSEGGSDSEDEGKEGGDEDEGGSEEEGEQQDGGPAGGASTSQAGPATATATATVDHWAGHVGRELSDVQAAELAAATGKIKFTAVEDPEYQAYGLQSRWEVCGGPQDLPRPSSSLAALGVKERLRNRWMEVHKEDVEAGSSSSGGTPLPLAAGDFVDAPQRSLFCLLDSYRDVMAAGHPYPTSSNLQSPDPILDALLLHCLNHVAKTADLVKKSNDRLRALREERGGAPPTAGEVPRDQGFTRAKVLLLLPQRNLALAVVRRLVRLALKETRVDSVKGKEKLLEQFTDPEWQEDSELDAKARARRMAKPAEHRALFAGNTDDHFRLGVKITRGAIRLFVDPYQADILISSPIALATKLAEEPDTDFLSSIELLGVVRADVMAMQNWAHVETVVEALNRLPREQHGTDIMRVREWYLSGLARHYRQTVLTTSFTTPDMNALFNRTCVNHAGKARMVQEHVGVLAQVIPQVQQIFERFVAPSPAGVSDARFQFFKSSVWPRLKESVGTGVLIFVPSYFDFVRLRNFLDSDEASFVDLSEYSKPGDATSARNRFFQRRDRMLLYTERAHFYNRHSIRGIRDVVFYGLPDHAAYYPELLNLMEEGRAAARGGASHGSVTALYCRWDVLQLERLVGVARARKMIQGQSSTFMFC